MEMEKWNAGMLESWGGAGITHFDCKKLLQTHYSITPLFHCSNWG
jgi:hypothetical protein